MSSWMPLESNPEVMNKFIHNLGVPKSWGISDVYGLDDDLLPMIPTPTLAFLLLFPTSLSNIEYKKKLETTLKDSNIIPPKSVYFMKQYIKNACGTVALIHAIGNNRETLKMSKDSVLEKFFSSSINASPEERADLLEKNLDISGAHESSAEQGQTEAMDANADVDLHFLTFVNVDGQLYELDGRMDMPLLHGPTTAETFVRDAAKICKGFMQRDPESLNFTVLALGPLD